MMASKRATKSLYSRSMHGTFSHTCSRYVYEERFACTWGGAEGERETRLGLGPKHSHDSDRWLIVTQRSQRSRSYTQAIASRRGSTSSAQTHTKSSSSGHTISVGPMYTTRFIRAYRATTRQNFLLSRRRLRQLSPPLGLSSNQRKPKVLCCDLTWALL